ncbi:unnamed protein product [Triticum turgidum subsp. durum]|nr:unnamed protein product [Triticum turgidum subsp. durum]
MELVVGTSEENMRSLLSKLGGLLSEEYTLIRGVDGDLQYINDELATMQSFLRYVGSRRGHDDLTKDWMKQIRDLTYDIEDCIDDSGNRLHGLPTGMPCYFLLNSVFEILTWWPRRDIAARISTLKMRAQQIGERRQRYVVNDPWTGEPPAGAGPPTKAAVFVAADNQDVRLQLVDMKDPVGVEQQMKDLRRWVTYLVGFGGVGKTAIATALYRKFKENFVHTAVVTVSQSSDVEAILRSIINQIKPKASNRQEEGGSTKSAMATIKGVMVKYCSAGTSEGKHDGTKKQLMNELKQLIEKKRYLLLIDDVWSASMLENIIKELPDDKTSRIIVTTRFHSVATPKRDTELRRVTGLAEEKSKKLFEQAFSESKGNKDVAIIWPQDFSAPPNTEEVIAQDVPRETRGRIQPHWRLNILTHKVRTRILLRRVRRPTKKKHVHSCKQGTPETESQGSEDATVPNEVWKMCGGLPLAIVTMAGHVACNPDKSLKDWSDVCSSLFPELGQDHIKKLTQEEVGRIISYCYDDMPAEIKTCSMYLSIFPKGDRISRKRLTRRWIAEGFVREKHGLSMEEVAETYFNHLIRRKIIRPVEHSSNGKVKKCTVHDMVLEHIVAKASEENFITVVGGNWLMQPSSSKVRRLSLQACDSNRAKDTEKMNMSHVRSVTMFGSLNNQLHAHLFKLEIVQIMDLEGCKGFKQHHIIEICRMVLLK